MFVDEDGGHLLLQTWFLSMYFSLCAQAWYLGTRPLIWVLHLFESSIPFVLQPSFS